MNEIKFLDKYQTEKLLSSIKNLKYKVLVLIMIDAGLRVSEVIDLRYSDFDFKRELIIIRSLKKRKNHNKTRKVPISKRLYQVLAEYLSTKTNLKGDDYLFPSPKDPSKHIIRFTVNKHLLALNKSLGFENLHPHQLRHTFGTNHIAAGTPLENIKTMLGHEKYDTTLIYAQIPSEILRNNIKSVTEKEDSYLQKVLKKAGILKSSEKRISINFHQDKFTIGRKEESIKLAENAQKGINTLILGPIGIGKSHLLDTVQTGEKKILKIDDLTDLKKTLGSLLLYLYKNDKAHCAEMIYGDIPLDKISVKINKLSVRNLAEEICKAVQVKEYIISIDTVDRITPKGVQILELLKDHFVIFCAAREVKVDRSSFAWNFDRIDIKALDRPKSMDLINKLSYDIEVEDQMLFKNHIFEQSAGNPRVIFEIIDRYRREPVITNEVVKNIRHTASLQEFDLTFVIFIGFGCMYMLRYLSREMDNEALRFIGGAALVLMLLSRQFFGFTKRKSI